MNPPPVVEVVFTHSDDGERRGRRERGGRAHVGPGCAGQGDAARGECRVDRRGERSAVADPAIHEAGVARARGVGGFRDPTRDERNPARGCAHGAGRGQGARSRQRRRRRELARRERASRALRHVGADRAATSRAGRIAVDRARCRRLELQGPGREGVGAVDAMGRERRPGDRRRSEHDHAQRDERHREVTPVPGPVATTTRSGETPLSVHAGLSSLPNGAPPGAPTQPSRTGSRSSSCSRPVLGRRWLPTSRASP